MAYELRLTEMIVTEFNEEAGDWSGEMFSKGLGGFMTSVEFEELTADNLREASSQFTGLMADEIDIYINDDDGHIQVSVIEDEDGFPNLEGGYLVDYLMTVDYYDVKTVDLSGFGGYIQSEIDR